MTQPKGKKRKMDDLAERKEKNDGYQAESKETKNGRTSRKEVRTSRKESLKERNKKWMT